MAARAARWDASSTGSSPNTATKESGLSSWIVAPKVRTLSASVGSTPPVSATGAPDPARLAYRNARWRPSHRALTRRGRFEWCRVAQRRRRRGGIASRGRRPSWRRRRRRRTKPVLVDAIAKLAPRDSEPRRRAQDVPAAGVERIDEARSLDPIHLVLEPDRRLGHPRRRPRRGLGRWQAQGLLADAGGVGQQRHPLHRVGELPHVARPRMSQERGPRLGAQRLQGQAVVPARAGEEVLGEQKDVGPAGAEGREGEDDDGEPVIEILAEPARPHGLRQVLVARRDDPDHDRLAPRAARGAGPRRPRSR